MSLSFGEAYEEYLKQEKQNTNASNAPSAANLAAPTNHKMSFDEAYHEYEKSHTQNNQPEQPALQNSADKENSWLSDMGHSLVGGVYNGMANMSDAASMLFGVTPGIRNYLASGAQWWENKSREQLEKVNQFGLGTDIANSFGSSLPSVAASTAMALTGNLPTAGSMLMPEGVMTGGEIANNAAQMYRVAEEALGNGGDIWRKQTAAGVSPDVAQKNANYAVAAEIPFDIFAEKIGQFGNAFDKISNPAVRESLKMAGESIGQGAQEVLQNSTSDAAEASNGNPIEYLKSLSGNLTPEYLTKQGKTFVPATLSSMLLSTIGMGLRNAAQARRSVPKQKQSEINNVEIQPVPGMVAPTPTTVSPEQTIRQNVEIAAPVMTVPATQAENFRRIAGGAQAQIYTSNGRAALPVTYKAVPAEALNVSNTTDFGVNKNYPQEFQPRDRTRAINQTQVNAITNNMNPELLGESARASDGAPVTDANGTVIAGNGRSLAIQRAYEGQTKTSRQYKGWLVMNAKKFGLDSNAVRDMKNPVLVRVLNDSLTPDTLAKFAADSNVPVTAGMSATEQAQADAKLLNSYVLGQYHTDADILSAENKPFMRTFIEQLPTSERNEFLDSRGNITQTGVRRVKNALFSSAYGDAALSERMSESTDDNTRLINEGMLRSAPSMAAVESGVKSGTVLKDYSLAPDIAAAVNKMSDLRNSGVKVSDYLNQRMAFEDAELSPNAKKILAFLDRNARNVNKIRDLFNEYAHNAMRFSDTSEQNLFDEQIPTSGELLDAAIKRVTGEDDLFFVGQKAAQTEDQINKNSDRINALRTAEDMENKMNAELYHSETASNYQKSDVRAEQAVNNQKIWAATGWYRGLDGRWRYEIPSGKLKADLSTFKDNTKYNLNDVIDAPQLFQIYPDLKNIDVIFKRERSNVLGYFNYLNNFISINKEMKSMPHEVLKTLVHETQHAIQQKEGFAGGASMNKTAAMQRDFNMTSGIKNVIRLQEYFKKRGVKLPVSFKSFIEKYIHLTLNVDTVTPDSKAANEIAGRLLEMEKNLPDDVITRLRNAVRNLLNVTGIKQKKLEMYMNNAGEIEARNAEKRIEYTQQKRNASYPLTEQLQARPQTAEGAFRKNIIVPDVGVETPLRFPEDTFGIKKETAAAKTEAARRTEPVRQINLFDDGQAPIPFRVENANQSREEKYNAAIKEGNIKAAQKLVNEAAEEAGFDVSGQVDDSEVFIGDKKHSYRGYVGKNSPVSDYGHMMFTDDPDKAYWSKNTSNIQDELYSVSFDDLVDINDLRNEIIQKINEDRENPEAGEWGRHDFSYLDNLSAEEIADEFNPDQIVDSAGAWDDGDLVEWFWDRIGYPHDLKGVKTHDGAIAFEGSGIVKRVANNAPVLRDSDGNIIPLSKRFNTTEKDMDFEIGDVKKSHAPVWNRLTRSKEALLTRAQDVMDMLNQIVPVRRGVKGPSSMLGVYKRNADVVRIRFYNDIPTALHEVGHKLDAVLNLRGGVETEGSAKINSELEHLGVSSSPESRLNDVEYLRKEGIAEFFRLWALDPEQARKAAPIYYDKFEQSLAANPDVQTLANQAGEIARTYYRQSPEQRLDASIVEGGGHGKKYSWKRIKEGIYYAFLDDKIFLKKFTDQVKDFLLEHNPEVLIKDKKGRYWMPDELNLYAQVRDSPGYMGKVGIYLDKIQPIVKSIGAQQYKLLNRLMTAQGAMDYWNNDMEPGIGITQAEAQSIIDATPQNIKDAAAEIRKTYAEIVDDTMVKAGIWSKQAINTWRKKYPYYVPFQRLSEAGDLTYHAFGAGGLKIVNIADPHKKRTGVGSVDAQRSIRSPLESMFNNVRTYSKMAAKNEAAQTLVRLSQIDGFGWAAEQLQDHTKEGKQDTVYVWQNGQKFWYQVDHDIYNSLIGLEERLPEAINKIINIISLPSKTLKLGATGLNIAFGPVNAFRDAMQSALTSDSWRAPFTGTIKGLLMQMSRNSEKQQRVKTAFEAGLKYSGIYELGLGSTEESVSKHIKHLIHGDSAWSRFVMGYNNTVGSFNEAVEVAPKIAEFEYLRSQGVPLKQAIMMAREVNIDFSRAGSLGRIINRPVAFFNAGMQGLDKMIRSGLEQRSKFLLKTALFVAVPTVLSWAMHKDDDEYRRLSRHLRDNFWLIKTGNHTWLRFPKPEGVQPLMGAIERALDYAFHKDPEAFNGMLDSFGDVLPNFAPTAGIPFWQHFTNTAFTGAPLVPRKLQNLPPEMQYTRNTSSLAKLLGKAFHTSPIVIDNYIAGYTGGVGKTAVRIPDVIADMAGVSGKAAPEAKTIGEYPVLNRWTANSLAGSEPVERFYGLLDESRKAYNGFKAEVKAGNHPELTPEIKIAREINKASSMMSKISAAIAAVRERQDMTSEEKRARNEDLREKQIQLAERVLKKYEEMKKK